MNACILHIRSSHGCCCSSAAARPVAWWHAALSRPRLGARHGAVGPSRKRQHRSASAGARWIDPSHAVVVHGVVQTWSFHSSHRPRHRSCPCECPDPRVSLPQNRQRAYTASSHTKEHRWRQRTGHTRMAFSRRAARSDRHSVLLRTSTTPRTVCGRRRVFARRDPAIQAEPGRTCGTVCRRTTTRRCHGKSPIPKQPGRVRLCQETSIPHRPGFAWPGWPVCERAHHRSARSGNPGHWPARVQCSRACAHRSRGPGRSRPTRRFSSQCTRAYRQPACEPRRVDQQTTTS